MPTVNPFHRFFQLAFDQIRKRQNIYILFPIITGIILFSIHITGDIYGDEFLTYSRVLQIQPSTFIAKPLYLFNNDTFASIGYYFIRAPWAIRVHSLFFAVLTVIAVGKLAELLLGREYQLTAMWLAALSPMLIEYGGEARPYATLAFLGTAFLFCLIKFEQSETWTNAAFLGAVSIVGCLYRMQFAVYLVYAAVYYLIKRRRITKFVILGALISIPLAWKIFESFVGYAPDTPKVPTMADPVSTLNFLIRTIFSFNFGYCTFLLPELGAARNVPFLTIIKIKQNWLIIFLSVIAAQGICVGVVQYAKRQPRTLFFLLSFILLPTAGIILAGQLGYAIIREKYLIAIIGPYLVLLTAIGKELVQRRMGWIPITSFALVIAVSLYHYTVFPEKYSRRMMPSALNEKIIRLADRQDLIISYHISEHEKFYFTFLEKDYNYIDIKEDIKAGMSLIHYIKEIDQKHGKKVFIINNEMRRNWIDTHNVVLNYFKRTRKWKNLRFGRNLSLFIFDKAA
jgi:hypothetical protein